MRKTITIDITFVTGYIGFINSHDSEILLVKNYRKPSMSLTIEGLLQHMKNNNCYVNLENLVEFYTKIDRVIETECYSLREQLVSITFKKIKSVDRKRYMVVEAEYI